MRRLSLDRTQPVQETQPVSVNTPANNLRDRIESIQRRIGEAAVRSGRTASAITLVAAIKTVDAAVVLDAYRFGIRDIGENRVQEASVKREGLREARGMTHHFIGQLQTNKVRRAVELFDVIQSVDRMRLAETIDRAALELGKRQRCLIEVKISSDAAKGGASVDEVRGFVEDFRHLGSLQLDGLMGIAPHDADEKSTRAAFRTLAKIFGDLKGAFGSAPVLSMGMTGDFEMAIEEGATMVRIGRAMFGERTAA
jgi:pyridoxal phosphate enzyme (YggS family)